VLQTSCFFSLFFFAVTTPQGWSALSLFVLRVFADNTDDTLSLDNLALFADWLNGRSNLHFCSPFGLYYSEKSA